MSLPVPAAQIFDSARTALLVAALLAVALLLVASLRRRRRRGAAPGPAADPHADDPPREAEAGGARSGLAAAARRHEAAGDLARAAALHLRAGAPLRAAGIHLRAGNSLEAARIFSGEGDHLRAAQALEFHGDPAAAAREYSAAGNHARAARLFEQQGRYAEAAAAYRPILGDGAVSAGNAGLHTSHAALLALAGDRDRAAAAYLRVLAAVPGHLRASSGLQSLLTRTPGSRFRTLIPAGRLEPRRAMRLWVRAMRALSESHQAETVYGCLTPGAFVFEREDVLRIVAPGPREPYVSPEVLAGGPPDRQSDIYSMGVILFEMVTGETGQFGSRRACDLVPDVPQWLDELIERCTDRDSARRFRTTEEVSAALLTLKSAAAG